MDKPIDTIPDDVWLGNEPEGISGYSVDGYPVLRWNCKYGGGYTINGRISKFDFSINKKVSIFICGDTLCIRDYRRSKATWSYVYCNNSKFSKGKGSRPLEQEKIEKYLNTKIPNCKAWDMVQKRAWELYRKDDIYDKADFS